MQRNAAEAAAKEASSHEAEARRNQVAALAALANATLATDPTRAAKLALAAWPRREEDRTPKLDVTVSALGGAVSELRERKILRDDSFVISAVFSPDGTRVVTASYDKSAKLWDAATGRQIAVLRHDGPVNSAVFSPDGTRIITASVDNTARLWDATGKQIAILRHNDIGARRPNDRSLLGGVNNAVFSPDGFRVVTASGDKTARLWSAGTGRQIAILQHDEEVHSAVFSPDGTLVVTASDDRTARLWDAAGKQIAVLRHDDIVYWRRLLAGRDPRRHRLKGQHRTAVGRSDRQADRRPAPRRLCQKRRLLAGRESRRHRLRRQHRAAMGRGGRQANRSPEPQLVRRLTPGHRKEIFDIYAAMPSSWKTPRMAERTAA